MKKFVQKSLERRLGKDGKREWRWDECMANTGSPSNKCYHCMRF